MLAFITPESLVNFGTVALLFMTPVAVLINTVMLRSATLKVAQENRIAAAALAVESTAAAEKVATQVAAVAVQAAASQEIVKASGETIKVIHDLTNSSLARQTDRADAAEKKVVELTAMLAALVPSDLGSAIKALIAASEHKASDATKP